MILGELKQNWLEKVVLPLGDWALGTSYINELQNQRKYVKMSHEELLHLQNQKLIKLASRAANLSPFYSPYKKELLRVQTATDLKDLPVLTKKELRERLKDVMTCSANKKGLQTTKTSGSTGPHTTLY